MSLVVNESEEPQKGEDFPGCGTACGGEGGGRESAGGEREDDMFQEVKAGWSG